MTAPRVAATLVALLLASAPAVAAQHPLVELPLDDPAYAQLEGLVHAGCGAARVSAFRPFMVKDIRAALRQGAHQPRCTGRVLRALSARFLTAAGAAGAAGDSAVPPPPLGQVRLGASATLRGTALHGGTIDPLWRDVRPTAEGVPSVVGLGNVRLTWSGGANVVAVSEVYGETDRRNDPTVRAGLFRNTQAVIDVSDAYVSGKLGPLVLSVGRSREAWTGEGDESLVLSANGPALDRITLAGQWSHWEFKALVASLNDVVLTPALDGLPDSVGGQRWHRMMFAHALTYRPSHSVELTIGETALLPRQGGGIDLAFVNPVMIFQVAQEDSARATNPAGNTNLTAFGSVRANLGAASLQGELVIDDIQIDPKDRRVFPDLLGWNVHGTYALPTPLPVDLDLQYRRIGSFTYLERFYTDSWQQYNQPIGSELGPDADLGRAGIDVWPSGRLHVSAGISRWRHGAKRIDARPIPNRQGAAGQPFPSTSAARPAVQRAWLGDASVEWLGSVLPVTARVEGARATNVDNIVAPARTLATVQLFASYRFRYP